MEGLRITMFRRRPDGELEANVSLNGTTRRAETHHGTNWMLRRKRTDPAPRTIVGFEPVPSVKRALVDKQRRFVKREKRAVVA